MFPGPEACRRGQARAITMVMGERRSRQKNTVAQKDMSTHLSIFQILHTIDFYRLEGLLQCSPPVGLCGQGGAANTTLSSGNVFCCKKKLLCLS